MDDTLFPGRGRLLRARGIGIAFLLIASTVCVDASAGPAVLAAAATFDPVPSIRMGAQSVHGRVVTDGAGTFHSIVREDGVNQVIVYRRSVDGGATWTVRGRFAGDGGGAGRPWIAVDGDRVAIVFIGLWCEPGKSFCEEVPYLVASADAGMIWAPPRRLDTQAFDVRVAVDDNRTWVSWQRQTSVELRGTTNNGVTMFASRTYPGWGLSIDAADETMVLALRSESPPPSTDSLLSVVTARGQVVAPVQTVPRPAFLLPSVATADGTSHVLLVDNPLDPIANPPSVWVMSATGTNPVGAPVVVMPAGQSATIDAASGTVAVAVSDRQGTTWVATSSSTGTDFSAAIPVSSSGGSTPLAESQVELSIATPPQGRPLARFDWSVPDRYIDTDGNQLPDPANGTGNDVLDQLRVYANQAMTVALKCGSQPSTGRPIANYTWYVDGTVHDSGPALCETTITVDDGATAMVRLLVEDDAGTSSSVEQAVSPRDHLIVSIGDSVASGEGSPHTGGAAVATWQDGACHRSALAGPALAAQQLEASDPRSSVTFVQLSCSGAAIVDVPELVGADDPTTGGLLDSYSGIVPSPSSLRPSQLEQMTALVGNRPVDALLVSIGANDAKFSEVVKDCLSSVYPSCDRSSTRTTFESRISSLPGRYSRLASAIAARGVPANRVRLTEYFDPTSDDLGITEMRCAVRVNPAVRLAFGLPNVVLLEDDEAIWARDGVIGALNAAGRSAAAFAGWRYVGGIAQQFKQHGYCAGDHWVVQLGESTEGQDDINGAFHPNRAGQQVYGSALFADLRATLLVPAPATSPGTTGGPTALGDMMVVTTTYETVTSAAVDVTGGAPLPGGVRRLDRLALGDEGLLYPAGPPAVDGAAAVAMWTELSGVGAFSMQTLAAQIAVRPNAAVRKVNIVQAPADGSLIVAGRESLVQATIDAMIAGPQSLDVTTTVTASVAGGERQLVPPTTERITFKQGRNVVLLPVGSTFAAAPGETLSAIVEVSDPIGASASDDVDNVVSTTLAQQREAVTTRPLQVMVGRAGLGGSTLSCQTTKGVAERMVDYATVAMPVDAQGVEGDLFCGVQPALVQSEPGLLAGLATLDELARYTGSDAVVLVVPDGWLQAAAGGAVGAAVAGMRGVILEATAPEATLSHELAHIFGLGHTVGLVPAFGARVDTRADRAGSDWMAERAQAKSWTGGANWDRLARTIGGPANAPQPLDPTGGGIWVRGTVAQRSDGSWGVSSGQWLPAGTGTATDPIATAALDLSRMSVDQVDANGNVVDSKPVGLGPAAGLYAADATPAGPFGYGFSTRVAIDPLAVSLSLVLDGVVVETVAISAAPTVSLASPTAGANVPRGDPLTVEWASTDPDGDPLTADVFISDDNGVTWRPLAAGVTGQAITVPVPQDVGGTAVRVRVVVSDGLRFAEAVSGAFSAEPDVSLGEERLVFIRDLTYATLSRPRVTTMRPDGTDVAELALPAASVYPTLPGGETLCTLGLRSCDLAYRDPDWGADDRIYFSSDLLMPQYDGPDDTVWERGYRIWSSKPDGSDLQRVTAPASDASYWPANTFGQSLGNLDNQCPAISPDGNHLAWVGNGSAAFSNVNHLWIVDRVGTGWSSPTALVTAGPQPALTMHPSFPTSTAVPTLSIIGNGNEFSLDSCPHWSPDSTSVALIGPVTYGDGAPTPRITFDYSAVVVAAIDRSSIKLVSPMPTYIPGTGPRVGNLWQADFYESVDWLGNSLRVTRGFEDLATFDPGGGMASSPKSSGVFALNPLDGSLTRLTPQPDVYLTIRPNKFKVAPDGTLYGTLYRPVEPQCPYGASDLVLFQLGSGGVGQVQADRPAGSCTVQDRSFDWTVRPGSGGTGGGLPLLVVDPTLAPDDGNAPVDIDVTTITAPSQQPAAGADEIPSAPLPRAATLSGIVVPADASTELTLRTVDGTPAPFQIGQLSPPGEMRITTSRPDGFAVTTELDGRVLVTPAPGFRGVTTFTFFVLGDPTHVATATITVVGNAPPLAADDSLVVPVATETTFAASALLDNDVDPDAAGPAGSNRLVEATSSSLRLVAVFASGNGRAWLDEAGIVHVLAEQPGAYSFSYIVADQAGATDSALARVTSLPAAVDPTSTTTTIPTTVPPGTATTTTVPAASPPVTTLAPAPGGTLPRTGGTLRLLRWAALSVALGVSILVLGRRAGRRVGRGGVS